MQISIEITGTLGRRLHVVVPSDQLEKAIDKDLQHYAHTAKLDGFRPGKVPMRIVRQYFGEQARAKAIDQLLKKSLSEAIEQEKLRLVERSLSIESLEATPGQPMKYIATFEIYPEIKLQDFSTIELEKLAVAITDSDVDQVLEKIRKQHALWHEVQRAAQWGDRVTFDLFVKLADDAQPKKQQENLALILEKDQLPAGFDVLFNAKAGDEIKINSLSKEQTENAGAELNAKILTVTEPQLPELNAEFAEKLGVAEGTLEALRAQVRQHMERELETVLKNKLKMQLLDKLFELYVIDLPTALVDLEAEHIQKEMRDKSANKAQSTETEQTISENAITIAKRRVTIGLLFNAIAQNSQLVIDEDRVRAHVERIATAFEDPQATVNLLYKYKDVMQNIRAQAMEEQVIDKILEKVQYHTKEIAYSEAMRAFSGHMSHAAEHDHAHDHEHGPECYMEKG